MKFSNTVKIALTIFLLTVAAVAFACSGPKNENKATNSKNGVPEKKPPTMTDVPVGNAQSPTEAYKMLFAAVKSQDPAKIKSMLTKATVDGLAAMAAGQQKKTVEQVIENGFTETTFADNMPQTRDERVKDNMGALEVWNEKRKSFEDIPFMWEDGGWKAAFGDAFSGAWKSPGKSMTTIEQENANAANPPKLTPMPSNLNANFRGGGNIKKMKNLAPQ